MELAKLFADILGHEAVIEILLSKDKSQSSKVLLFIIFCMLLILFISYFFLLILKKNFKNLLNQNFFKKFSSRINLKKI